MRHGEARCVVLLAVAMTAFDAHADVAAIDIHVTPTPEKYFVTFAARPSDLTAPGNTAPGRIQSIAGHAFVAWTEVDGSGNTVENEAFGLHTLDGSLSGQAASVFSSVPAAVRDEINTGSLLATSDVVRVQVEPSMYAATRAYRQNWAASHPGNGYHIVSSDCVSFLQDVANIIGLNAPSRVNGGLLPQHYVHSLVKALTSPTRLDFGDASWEGTNVMRVVLTGNGKFTQADGTTFQGELRAGQMNGHGRVTAPNGATLEAGFERGLIQGAFNVRFPNGDTVSGTASNGNIFEGPRTYQFAGGGRIEGTYSGGNFNGPGTYVFKNGDTVTGTFSNGTLTGTGTYTTGGHSYPGDWQNGVFKPRAPPDHSGGSGRGDRVVPWDMRGGGGGNTANGGGNNGGGNSAGGNNGGGNHGGEQSHGPERIPPEVNQGRLL